MINDFLLYKFLFKTEKILVEKSLFYGCKVFLLPLKNHTLSTWAGNVSNSENESL